MEKTKGETYRSGLEILVYPWEITILCGTGAANETQDTGAEV